MRKTFIINAFVLAFICLFSVFLFAGTVMAKPGTLDDQQYNDLTPEQIYQVLLKAAESGNARAMLAIGTLYERGAGVSRNLTKALDWYSKAADSGLPEGLYNTAVCYEVGIGVRSDQAQAIELFKQAADKNMPQALYKLAMIYINGAGVPVDQKKGIEFLEKAVEAGHPSAPNDLGVIYLQGFGDVEKDTDKALLLLVKAAGLGNGEAMKNVAVIYNDGIGRPTDKVKALQWYLLAQKAGFQSAEIDVVIKDVRQGMTPAQIEEAEKLVENWQKEQQQSNKQTEK